MKKAELHDLVLETVNEYINEAELKTGDNEFTIKVDVNRNPTKKGIKIQLIPKGDTILNDPDIKQATDNPNVLGYYIPLNQFKNLITKALKGE